MGDHPPTIVVITCHDLGRHLGCYGVPGVHTPHLDRLAATGVRFTHAFSTSPGCSPARAGIATGRYPHANGVMGLTHPPFGWDLRPGERPIAALLHSIGYGTHLFGFQHITQDAARLGFHALHDVDRSESALSASVASRVATFLDGECPAGPLYLEINLEEPHRPFDQGGAVPDPAAAVSVPPYLPDDDAAREEMAAFGGAIRQADDGVGRVLAALDAVRLTDDAIVTFVADHGIAMPRAKGTLYDAGIEVALLMRLPGGAGAGRTPDGLVSTIDLLPTLLELAGAPVPETVQGRSFAPLLRGEAEAGREEVHAEKTYHSYYDPMRAVRTRRYKYIVNFEPAFAVEVPGDVQRGAVFRRHVELFHGAEHPLEELYDLETDPAERHNLAGEAAAEPVRREMAARLRRWMERTDDPLLHGPVSSPAYARAIARI